MSTSIFRDTGWSLCGIIASYRSTNCSVLFEAQPLQRVGYGLIISFQKGLGDRALRRCLEKEGKCTAHLRHQARFQKDAGSESAKGPFGTQELTKTGRRQHRLRVMRPGNERRQQRAVRYL